jgi:hypothetical protein
MHNYFVSLRAQSSDEMLVALAIVKPQQNLRDTGGSQIGRSAPHFLVLFDGSKSTI